MVAGQRESLHAGLGLRGRERLYIRTFNHKGVLLLVFLGLPVPPVPPVCKPQPYHIQSVRIGRNYRIALGPLELLITQNRYGITRPRRPGDCWLAL